MRDVQNFPTTGAPTPQEQNRTSKHDRTGTNENTNKETDKSQLKSRRSVANRRFGKTEIEIEINKTPFTQSPLVTMKK